MLEQMESLLTLARDAAREAARISMTYYGNAIATRKLDDSLITNADTHIHDYLLDTLRVSGIPILSEEDTEHLTLPYPEHLWIVDPLDGTNGFVRGTGDFAVMIGLLERGRPVLGVVHIPVEDTVFFSQNEMGAMRSTGAGTDAVTLQVSARTSPQLRAVQSVSHAHPYMTAVAETLGVTESIGVGSIGIKASVIARDGADYFLTLGALGEWDVCAPEAILVAAGGKVTDAAGAPLSYGNKNARIARGAVFSNSVCHDEVIGALGAALEGTKNPL